MVTCGGGRQWRTIFGQNTYPFVYYFTKLGKNRFSIVTVATSP